MSERPPSQPSLFDASIDSRDGALAQDKPFDSRDEALAQDKPPSSRAPEDSDASAREFAVDPRNNVVLEASAGTGKTSVLVARYVNLLKAGVEPANILAITFTRKAAAEMRERIVRELRDAAARSAADRARWLDIRDRLGEIAISTIDAFCLSLLREFPLEADLDPGFEMADEPEVPRLIDDALDRSFRIFGAIARNEPDIAMVLAQLGVTRTREGLGSLLDRRLVAWDALNRFLVSGPSDLTAEVVCRRAAVALQDTLRAVPGGLAAFLADGPAGHPRFQLLVRGLHELSGSESLPDAELRAVLDRVAAHFLTAEGRARRGGSVPPYNADHYPSSMASKRHRAAVIQVAPQVESVVAAFARDLNVVLARGVRRMFAIALEQYRQALDERSVLDFSDVLQRALDLLRRMDEFSQSRFRLESRYHHVLVDEFQDTSRAQWELVSLLIQAWKEGLGVAAQPSIFIVGDRKQSIYRFRDADVSVLQEAARHIEALRPDGQARRTISRSYRALPELLEFVNDVFAEISQPPARPDDFTYTEADRFPTTPSIGGRRGLVLGVAADEDPIRCSAAVAVEIERILRDETVRDKTTGVARQARPGDIAILFRSRTSHREFEHELELRGIPSYVYKGLGFFDADEIKDLTALIRYLANPDSDLRASAFLRSRFVRLSDGGLSILGPRFAEALAGRDAPGPMVRLDDEDRIVLDHVRSRVPGWIALVDRVPPADLIEQILPQSAYAFELRGGRRHQAWENVKKMRGLVRRIQNRGYATLARIADHIDALTPGDESNAVLEALDAVNLMTVHAAKGLEFPVVFVVNLAKGATGPPRPIRVAANAGDPSVSVGPFVSDTDEAERTREKHETRRLLYVALTRARDRLYLSSALKEGMLQPGRGSLAEVLPESLKPLFSRAATAFDECGTVAWSGPSGHPFEWRICRPPSTEESRRSTDPLPPAPDDRFDPLTDRTAIARSSVVDWLDDRGPGREVEPGREGGEAIVGTLVHRLFQHAGLPAGKTGHEQAQQTLGLLRPEERAAIDRPDAVVARALSIWQSLRARSDVAALLSSGRCLYEVPFSWREGSVILRGAIDCVVERADGSIAVIEFKTGARRPAYQRQLDLYVRAARALYAGARVEGTLVCPE
jgi:ATP-dependent helicase/nuclease subunit A